MTRLKTVLRTSLTAAACFAVLGACTTTNPYTGEEQTRKSVKYGSIGAVVCGLIGATESSKRARNAAAGCGAIGAGVGAYMDHQESELRQELQGTGVGVERVGDQIKLIMPGNITFNTNEYSIRSEFYSVLDSVAKVLAKYEDTRMRIAGFTDSTGADDYNLRLSRDRARSVADYLSGRGVAAQRLVPEGFGEAYPVASNDSTAGRAQNRRVELTIDAVQQG